MSNWTHVAAIVRVDSFRSTELEGDSAFEYDTTEVAFEKIFGKECLFDSPEEIWRDAEEHPDDYLPMGCEGSLRMSVWVNPNRSHLAAYTVSIFGDLRDHHSSSAVVEWFKEKLKGVWVRQATITASNEWSGTVNWTYSEEEEAKCSK